MNTGGHVERGDHVPARARGHRERVRRGREAKTRTVRGHGNRHVVNWGRVSLTMTFFGLKYLMTLDVKECIWSPCSI